MKILFAVFFDPQDLGCRYLSAFMKEHGHAIRIICLKSGRRGQLYAIPTEDQVNDMCNRVSNGLAGLSFLEQMQISDHELALLTESVAEWNPDIVGFGTRSKNFVHLPRIIPALRAGAPDAFMVAGGFGPSLEPHIPLEMGVDAVIRGEGEYSLLDLVNALEQSKDWRNIPGIAYLKDGRVHSNPIYTPQKNLDVFPLPFVDESEVVIIDNDAKKSISASDKNNEKLWGTASYIILTSRGCICDCSYCGGRALRDSFREEGVILPKIRRRSLANVMKELKIVKENNPKVIIFIDEFFVHPVSEMISFFIDYKKLINLPFFAHISVDQIVQHPELLDALVDAGWHEFSFGIQTGNSDFCKYMYNRNNNNDHIIKAIAMCHERGLSGYVYMILGNPLESEQHKIDSLNLARLFPPFDPSFKQYLYFETSKLWPPYGNVLIKRQFPEILTQHCSSAEFYYDAMMLEFRLVLTDEEFDSLRANPLYRKSPYLLGSLLQKTRAEKHRQYFHKELKRIRSKHVYLYGGGTAYQHNKHLIDGMQVDAILIDMPTNQKEIDGIKVIDPSKKTLKSENPVILMSRFQNINTMVRKFSRTYPQFRDVITCIFFDQLVN